MHELGDKENAIRGCILMKFEESRPFIGRRHRCTLPHKMLTTRRKKEEKNVEDSRNRRHTHTHISC